MIELDDDMLTIEAALYSAGRALTLEEIAELIGKAESTAKKLLDNLSFKYKKIDGALEVVQLPKERFVMQLKPELTPRVARFIPGGLLSFATLQTLVFIALKQPILQSDLVTQRGTHCYEHVKDLQEKKFIDAVPEGRSKLLTTTPLFADYFGLDHEKAKLKAQLKFKMKQILEQKKQEEEESI